MKYAELHCHSSFSMLDGASNPEGLVLRAKHLGLSALALTDHDDLGGIVRFSQAAKEAQLDGIIGAEITLEDDSHLTLLVETVEGYKNLCRLINDARFNCARGKPKVAYDNLFQRSKGLVVLSGCPHGKIASSLAADRFDEARLQAAVMKETFGDSFFLEVWDHHLAQERTIVSGLMQIAASQLIPYAATNNVHYATPGKRIVHDVLTCLRHEVTVQTAGRRLRPNGSWYLKSPQEMCYLWRQHPQAISNTLVIAERCQFRLGLLKPSLPVFPTRDGETHDGILARLVWEGAAKRYPQLTDTHIAQINHELSVISRLGLAPYFLIMWDIVNFANSKNIAVQGRGSAANSAVCYCLSITAVDPIGMELLFERFLSEGRDGPPDIDLDIAHQERENVLQYVYDKYGRDHAAMVCETITYRGPSAVRDAARVLGFSADQSNRLSAVCQYREAMEAAGALISGGIQQAGLDPEDHRVKLLVQVVAGLDRLPRHRSIHVGGFVLSGEPLGQMVPIEPASMPGRTVIQWDKDDLEPVGMIKIDLLGLGMLTVIQEGVRLVKQYRGIDVDIAHLDMTDPAIFEMFQKADTVGIFQVESRAQMNILPRLKPNCFYDIVISIALIRPGPIQGNIVHPYVRRRRGEEAVTYLHPSLEPVLKRTLGVPLFQEQGMRIAIIAAGFSSAQADQLRRVMSFKRSMDRMEKVVIELAEGMRKNGLSEEAIATITHQLEAFASYGFPESHSASFALLVFASAHLKHYYAAEFYCAMLNAQPMGFYSPATLIRDAIRHNVEVRPVDLAKSSWDCTLEQDAPQKVPALRIGLRYVQGLGPKAKEALQRGWQQGGPFTSVEDVCARSGLNWKALQVLASAGAFQSLHPGRREALWEVLALAKQGAVPPLLKLLKANNTKTPQQIPTMSSLEEMVSDYRTMGLSTGRHPMTYYRSWLKEHSIKSCAELSQQANNEKLTVAGAVIVRQRPGTAKGFVFLTLEDETGTANVIIRPKLFEAYRRVILGSPFLAITGQLQLEQNITNVIAQHIEHLPQLEGNPYFPSRNFH